jgi:RHS repeat-associated protein
MKRMMRRSLAFLALAFVIFVLTERSLLAQTAPVCDSGGVCGTDPRPTTDPSYGGLLAARPQKQNARGTRNPTVTVSGAPGTVPIVVGSQSYNKAFPLVSLPGRGLDLNLTLFYNSRVWDVDTANSTVSLNTDRDSPSYGFRLDFGFMEYDANNAQFILTESDGSKHSMPLTANMINGSIYDSSDGTFIEFNNQSLILVYRDGTTMKYQAFPSVATLFRPIQIKDRNGNYITINYVAGTGNDQHIDTVVDTLGRVIKFVYDGANHLSQITHAVSPATEPSGTHVWATFSWAQVPLTYSFSGLSVVSSPATGTSIWVLNGCTFANQTGYRFSYGAWGIINRIDQLSSSGLVRSYETYNFPDASQPLSDAPRYTSMTISPDGTATSQWNYAETQSGIGQITSETVTDPMGTSSTLTVNTDGTLGSTRINDSTGKTFRTAAYTWKNVGSSSMIGSVSTTDDAGNQSSVAYTYDGFGNVTDLAENDFGNTLIRHTITAYMPAPYSSNHILNLPKSIQVKDAGGIARSFTEFNYDQTMPTALGAVTQNDGSIATPRGNLTSVTRYSDAATPAGAIIRNFTYDSTGNMTIAQLDCCNQKKFNFDPNSKYAYLSSVVRGPDGGQQFTSGFAFNTDNGLLLSITDENSQPTSYQYDNMYRVKAVTLPPSNGTTVSQSIRFADDVLAPTVTSSSSASSAVPIKTFDGLGHLTRQDVQDSTTGNFVSTTQFQYDPIWRRKATSNPYAPGEPLLWNSTAYDALNRVTSITPPTGGSKQFNFVGNTDTITDAAGKQRKNYIDALGRLVRVDEPGWGDALTAIDSISISGTERSRTYVPPPQKCPRPPLPCDPQPNDPVTVYDTGKVNATINGAIYSYTYVQGDTTTSVASNLAGKINADPARVVNASPSGSTVNLYAVSPGVGGNSISVSTSSATSDSTDFGSGTTSFPASTFTPDLTGGENAVAQTNAVISATRHLTTTYTYDVLDNLRAVSQGAIGPVNGQTLAGQPRSYAYDDLGRLTSTTTPESGTVTNYYTKADGTTCSGDSFAICRSVDARAIIKTFSYIDPINRITGISYSDGTPPVSYSYDTGGQTAFALGRVTQISENGNSQAFTYDNVGRITSVIETIDGTNYQVQYAYNPANQLVSTTYPSGRIVKPDYYSVGFLKQIADASTPSTPYLQINSADYNGAGEVKNFAYGNGIKGAVTYNDHLQIATLRYFNPAAPPGTPDVLNLSYDYGTGNNGQIQAVHSYTAPGVEDTTKSELFTYDPWSRLSAAQTSRVDTTAGTWSLQWGYDRLGNRLQQTLIGGNVSIVQPNFIVDAGTNHITNSGFTYDSAGNLTHDATAGYTYDGSNRLTSVNNGSAVAAYTYFGPLRIKKVSGSTTNVYVYSGGRPIAEYANGSVSKEYVYAGSRLLATLAGTGITYHHPDHLSNRAETDASGNPVRSFGHFPYGETWYETSADQQKFTIYPRDSGLGESGLDYAMFRYYNSGEGRFMGADLLGGSIGMPQSGNRYAYVLNDPINSLDLWGLCTGFIGRDKDGNPIFGERPCHKAEDGDDSDGVSGSGGGGGSDGGGGDNGCGGPCPGGGGGGGGGGTDKDKKKKKKQDSPECKKAEENLRNLQEEERNEIGAHMHSMGHDVFLGAVWGCVLGIESGCLGGAAEGAAVGLGVWGVGGLWDSFQASRAQAKAQQEVDAKCN